MSKIRNSNFELLRLICSYGIVCMHLFGNILEEYNSIYFGAITNSLFNCCVSIFMLISGFYGVKFNLKKIVSLIVLCFFYSQLNFWTAFFLNVEFDFQVFLRSCTPILSRKYWYMTAYIIISIFSGYINKIPEVLKKWDYEKLIFLMLLVFSFLPTLFQISILGDEGKGVINMLLIYFLGKYINKYVVFFESVSIKKYVFCFFLVTMMQICLNIVFSWIYGRGFYDFSSDYSIFTITISVLVFLIFHRLHFENKAINLISKRVLAVYLLEGTVRYILLFFAGEHIKWNCGYVLIFALFITISSVLFDMLRDCVIGKPMRLVENVIFKTAKFFGKCGIQFTKKIKERRSDCI